MRVRYKIQGGHVHCRVFSGPYPGALCGNLVFRKGTEFAEFVKAFKAGFFPEEEMSSKDEAAIYMHEACTP